MIDARGMVPESLLCIDCGFNTAPGCSTRVEIEQAFSVIRRDEGVGQRFDDRTRSLHGEIVNLARRWHGRFRRLFVYRLSRKTLWAKGEAERFYAQASVRHFPRHRAIAFAAGRIAMSITGFSSRTRIRT
jgi:hypothetical protein